MTDPEIHFEPFLHLVELDQERALVHPICGVREDGSFEEIERRRPDGSQLSGPIEING